MADSEEKKPRRVWGNPNKPIQEEFDEPEVQMNTDYSNVVIVDNIPVVEEAKVEKLAGVLRKLFSAFGEIQDFHIPQEATGDKKTLGYAFFEYRTPEEAARAVAERDNTKLDKAHTLRVNVYSDLEKFKAVPDKFEHKLDGDANVDIKSLLSFLLDPEGRDQFCLRYGHETEVWWNDVQKKPMNFREPVNRGEAHTSKGKHWTDLYTAWSPKGTYLATYHVQGIVLWGGDKFEKIQRFSHPGVKLMDFSPCENYIVTCNTMDAQGPNDPECIIVWDLRTGQKLRGFDSGGSQIWPAFVWSSDDKYLARIARDKSGKEALFVYEAPDMGLLDKQSIKTPGARDLLWSPTDNILSYWVPEENNIPAKVSLIQIPSKIQVRERHLYNVTDIKLRWHNKGEFLMVKMSRQKKGKVVSSIFEMFRMRQKEIPVETFELEENVIAFAWEPNGQRFAIIHETAPNQNNVSFYSVKKKKIEKINTLEKRAANFLYWSPQGSQILLAGLAPTNGAPANNMNGQLEFYDADLQDTAATREHFKCTDIEWDPTGRYVITSVCQAINSAESWKYGTENGYRIWAYDGKGEGVWAQRSIQQVEYFYQALWRPRPASCLSKDQIATIRTNLRDKYWKKFEQEDEKLRTSLLTADAQARVKQRDDWKAYRSERLKEYREEAQDRAALRGGVLSDDEGDIESTEEVQEIEIGEPEIVVLDDDEEEETAGSRRNSKRRDDDE